MAPAFKHGKGTRVLIGAVDFGSMLNDSGVSLSVPPAKATPYGAGDEEYIAGIRSGTATFSGMFDGSTTDTQAVIVAALGSTGALVHTVGPGSDTVGAPARMFRGLPSGIDVSSPADGVVAVQVGAQVTGRVLSGRFLKALAATTSTGASAAVDGGAASTGGGTAHLHITAASTLTSVTVKVQHSSSSTAWADLVSFTASTATGVQRSTVAGAVKRYTREIRTAMTGGASKSVIHSVAFART